MAATSARVAATYRVSVWRQGRTPCLLLRPDGEDATATVILVHGAPGGRGMSALKRKSKLAGWSPNASSRRVIWWW